MNVTVDRARVRQLVRRELEHRLGAAPSRIHAHAALLEIYPGPECNEDLDFPTRKPCVIEPDRPCTNTGYCKKLGH